jgi:hypothetical protein
MTSSDATVVIADPALLAVASAVDGTVIRYYGNPYEGDSRDPLA